MKNRFLTYFLFSFSFFISYSTFAQPAYDDCATLFDLGEVPFCPDTVIFNNIDANTSVVQPVDVPTCFNGTQRDVFFGFTIPPDGSIVDFNITVSGIDGPTGMVMPQVALYRGDCSELQELACESAPLNATEVSFDIFGLTPGVPYFLRINDYSDTGAPNEGEFVICITEYIPDIDMGDVTFTASCTGTLYDSGGSDGDYSNNESPTGTNSILTICPQDFFQCLFLTVEEYNIENGFDNLTFYAGDDTNAPIITNLTGVGSQFQLQSSTPCITIGFTSDGSVTNPGFEITWECSPDTCTIPPIVSCSEPAEIPSIPYSESDLSTCFAGNTVANGPCSLDDNFLNGDDYIFTYDSPGNECISVTVTGANAGTGVAVYDDCPDAAMNCLGQAGGGFGLDPTIDAAPLDEAGTYYIVVANAGNCTPFDISIDTTTCPIIFPPAVDCEDALLLNGCTPNIPAIVTVGPGQGDPNFFQPGINDGCWGGIQQPNFTWFYFQVQEDGNFGFAMESNNPNEASDIDFQVWGPYENPDNACDSTATTQPLRSSWAAGADLTGLADVHPIFGTPVLDVCEGAGGDDFVSTIPVETGEWYYVFINDWGGAIVSGAININFDATTPGVLEGFGDFFTVSEDTALCMGQPTQLLATGGNVYQWTPETGLSCTSCPDPIATPMQTTEYEVEIFGVCNSITEQVTVEVFDVLVGNDLVGCEGEAFQLAANTDFTGGTFAWEPSIGLSCDDCPNPVVTATDINPNQNDTITYTITLTTPNCTIVDSLSLVVLEGTAPQYETANDTALCIGSSLFLGGVSPGNNTYTWTSDPIGFSDNSNNPQVTPSESTTYYLSVMNDDCPVPSTDSIIVTVDTFPILNVANDTSVCQEEPIVLGNTIPVDGYGYTWSPPGDIVDPDSPNPVIFPTSDQVVTLTAINGACTTIDAVDVQITEIEIELDNPEDSLLICKGTEVELSVSAVPSSDDVIWTPNDGSLNTNSGSEVIATPETITTYIAEIAVPGCAKFDTIVIAVDSIPEELAITPTDTSICPGEIVILSTPAYEQFNFPEIDFQWTPGSGLQSPDSLLNAVVQPSDTTTYFRITQNGICRDTQEATVNVIDPTPRLSVNDATICPGESFQVELTNPGDSIMWSPGAGLSCTDCPDPVVSPDQTTTYTVMHQVEGCPGATSLPVNVVNATLNFSIPDTTICLGETVQVELLNGDNPSWSPVDTTLSCENCFDPVINTPINATYEVQAEVQGCPASKSISITVLDTSFFLNLTDTIICRGAEVQLLIEEGDNLIWTPAVGLSCTNCPEPVANPDQSVVYTVTDSIGRCSASKQVTITVLDNPEVEIAADPDILEALQGQRIILEAVILNEVDSLTYQWSGSPDIVSTDNETAVVEPLDLPESFFTVDVVTPEGCSGTATIGFSVEEPRQEAPSAFTPNNDGVNDQFGLVSIGLIEFNFMQIFNRWGEMVFESRDLDSRWDGRMNGKEAPADVYVYIIEFVKPDGEVIQLKGDVTLIR